MWSYALARSADYAVVIVIGTRGTYGHEKRAATDLGGHTVAAQKHVGVIVPEDGVEMQPRRPANQTTGLRVLKMTA